MKLTTLQLVDRLTFSSYAHNRSQHPEKSLDFWRPLFPDVEAMEAMYQEKVA